jgi:archaemetzincin
LQNSCFRLKNSPHSKISLSNIALASNNLSVLYYIVAGILTAKQGFRYNIAAMFTNMKTIFLLLLLGVAACSIGPMAKEQKRVGVVSFGKIPKAEKDSLIEAVKVVYGFDVIDLGEQDIPKRFYVNIKTPRYRADSIIKYLKITKPDTIDYVIGLTAFDISTTKYNESGYVLKPIEKYTDWGVFGLGYVNGPSCVVSSYRLKAESKKLFIERIKKVVIHELGHNLGLPHCPNKHCVMRDAVEKISTIDNEGLSLCDDCRNAAKLKF